MSLLLVIVLILFLVGALPNFGYHSYDYGPSGLAGGALATPAGVATPDAWITTQTKLALLSTEDVSGKAIEVQSPETLADTKIWRAAMPRQPSAKYGIEDASNDMWITSAAKMHLPTGGQTPALDLNVDTREGVVPLLGMAPSQEGKTTAPDVRKMSGIQRVENEGEVYDEEVTREVMKAFDSPAFKDITVEVKNGVVRLTGTIPSWAWRLEAVATARAIPGVRAVEDDLRFLLAV